MRKEITCLPKGANNNVGSRGKEGKREERKGRRFLAKEKKMEELTSFVKALSQSRTKWGKQKKGTKRKEKKERMGREGREEGTFNKREKGRAFRVAEAARERGQREALTDTDTGRFK